MEGTQNGLYNTIIGSTLTPDEVSAIGRHARDINLYLEEQAIIFQQIASMIPDSLYLKIMLNE